MRLAHESKVKNAILPVMNQSELPIAFLPPFTCFIDQAAKEWMRTEIQADLSESVFAETTLEAKNLLREKMGTTTVFPRSGGFKILTGIYHKNHPLVNGEHIVCNPPANK